MNPTFLKMSNMTYSGTECEAEIASYNKTVLYSIFIQTISEGFMGVNNIRERADFLSFNREKRRFLLRLK